VIYNRDSFVPACIRPRDLVGYGVAPRTGETAMPMAPDAAAAPSILPAVIALFPCYISARRATRIDLLADLRNE